VSRYILGTEAALDLDTIWDYIAKHNIDAADRWIAGVHGSEPFCHGKRLAGVPSGSRFCRRLPTG
jgi:hypothetical protein